MLVAWRNGAALEQIVDRLSLEPQISADAWQLDCAIPEAGVGIDRFKSVSNEVEHDVRTQAIDVGSAPAPVSLVLVPPVRVLDVLCA